MRIRITTDHKQYRKGDIVEVTPNVGFGLIDSGIGILSKEMTATDIRKKKK